MAESDSAADERPLDQDELACLVRGVCGALIFSIPILYTMEVWWLADSTPTWKIGLFFVLGYGLCVGLNVFSGFLEADTFRDYLEDSATSLGLSALVSLLMLGLLGVTPLDTPLPTLIKQVVIVAVPNRDGRARRLGRSGHRVPSRRHVPPRRRDPLRRLRRCRARILGYLHP